MFGNKVQLEVFDDADGLLLSTTELRVDFDIRLLQGYNRAKIDIYNLSNRTAKSINSGSYVTLAVSTGGGPLYTLVNKFIVNNVYTEKVVPNSITSLLCMDSLHINFDMKQVAFQVSKPTLKRVLQKAAEVRGLNVNFVFHDFPSDLENYLPVNPVGVFSGKVEDLLAKLGREYGFTSSNDPINPNVKHITYHPLAHNRHLTNQEDRDKIVLETNYMRSNPIVGVADLKIDSLLDGRIACNSLLDTSNLITASPGVDLEYLAVVKDYLSASVSGNSIFQVLSVNHIGSTHKDLWSTKAIAVKAFKGTTISKYNWYN